MLAFITSSFWIKVVGFFPPSLSLSSHFELNYFCSGTLLRYTPRYTEKSKSVFEASCFCHSLTVNTIIRSHLSVDLFAYNVYSLFLLFSNLKAASASNAVSYLPA